MELKNNLYSIISADEAGKSFRLRLIPDSVIYRAHFPELPVTPGVCIIQIVSELLAELFPGEYELKSVINAKYLAVINPGETREIDCTFKKTEFADDGESVKVSAIITSADKVFTKLSLKYSRL